MTREPEKWSICARSLLFLQICTPLEPLVDLSTLIVLASRSTFRLSVVSPVKRERKKLVWPWGDKLKPAGLLFEKR